MVSITATFILLFIVTNLHIFWLSSRLVEFTLGFIESVGVDAVHDEHDAVSAPSVGPPQRTDLVLAPNIPDHETRALQYVGHNEEILARILYNRQINASSELCLLIRLSKFQLFFRLSFIILCPL